MVAGIAFGPWAGAGGGLVLGAARLGAAVVNGLPHPAAHAVVGLVSGTLFYSVAGAVAGYIVTLLRQAETAVADNRAREQVARTLHDGVLQTLALVERRSHDPALARLAREQERDLRAYLFGDAQAPATDIGAALRSAAARFEDAFDGRVDVLVADDLPRLDPAAVDAVAGAVGEALTNAGKHGHARNVTVYVEPDRGGVFCSVKDDGCGFDPDATPAGVGLARSVRGRVADVGGRAEVRSSPDEGTEVCLWV
jgi:signal transduction histidine kinase